MAVGIVYIPSNGDGTVYQRPYHWGINPYQLALTWDVSDERCTMPREDKPCSECGSPLAQEVVDGRPVRRYYTLTICTNGECINSWS
jgi:hypothetical protein